MRHKPKTRQEIWDDLRADETFAEFDDVSLGEFADALVEIIDRRRKKFERDGQGE